MAALQEFGQRGSHLEPTEKPEKSTVANGLFAPGRWSSIGFVTHAVARHIEEGGTHIATTSFDGPDQYFNVRPGHRTGLELARRIAEKLVAANPVEVLLVTTPAASA